MAAKTTPQDVHAVVAKQPLVGANHAAKMLGIKPPNFSRYRARLTEVPVEGSAAVFVKAEVETLRDDLARERAGRG